MEPGLACLHGAFTACLHGAFPPCPTYDCLPSPQAPPTAISPHTAFLPCPAYYSYLQTKPFPHALPPDDSLHGSFHHALPITISLYSRFPRCGARVSLRWEFPLCHTIPPGPYKVCHCASKHFGVLILSISTTPCSTNVFLQSTPAVPCPPPSPPSPSASSPCYHVNVAIPITPWTQEVSSFSRYFQPGHIEFFSVFEEQEQEKK